jgi:hypothetical protein
MGGGSCYLFGIGDIGAVALHALLVEGPREVAWTHCMGPIPFPFQRGAWDSLFVDLGGFEVKGGRRLWRRGVHDSGNKDEKDISTSTMEIRNRRWK